METLKKRHPDAYRQLCEENFAVQRSNSTGSSQTRHSTETPKPNEELLDSA